jgi:succinoglycan biosynthesis transport protein ExoP
MPQSESGHGYERDLRDYLSILRRRKWIVLLATVLATAAAVVFSLRQPALYRAEAKVVLATSNATGVSSFSSNDPNRQLATDADLAADPKVARAALKMVGTHALTPEQLLAETTITPDASADVLHFSVTDHNPWLATKLASAYAANYSSFRRGLATQYINRSRTEIEARLAVLKREGAQKTRQYFALAQKDRELLTLEGLQTSDAYLIRPATGSVQVQPRPVLAGVLGFIVGIALGLALALLAEAIDTRVRRADEVAALLKLPILAALPAPSKRFQREDKLVMLEEPTGAEAESFRMLRTAFDFVNLDRGARAVIITSAVETEGKSTTVANLAIAMARAGKRVALVDLDLRRPFLGKFFDLDGRPGLTNVALGDVHLEEALTPIPLSSHQGDDQVASADGNGRASRNGRVETAGLLDVLGSGPIPPDPGEFAATEALERIIVQLKEQYDLVLIDASPVLRVGDALALSSSVDAMLILARMKVVKRPMLRELRRLLDKSPTPPLGFVLTGATGESGYGYGYGYGYYKSYYAYGAKEASGGKGRKQKAAGARKGWS